MRSTCASHAVAPAGAARYSSALVDGSQYPSKQMLDRIERLARGT